MSCPITVFIPVEDALSQHSEDTRAPSVKPATSATPSTPLRPKRTREPVVSDYNTRHRDKRARLSDPGPGASRKMVRVSTRKKTESKQSQTPVPGPSRNLGELKSALKKNKTLPTKAVRREVFDGVLLRKSSFRGRAGDDERREDATSNGSDEVLSGLEGNGLPARDESSLADSNKGETLVITAF